MTVRSKVPSQLYKDNWEKIFGQKEEGTTICRFCGDKLDPTKDGPVCSCFFDPETK